MFSLSNATATARFFQWPWFFIFHNSDLKNKSVHVTNQTINALCDDSQYANFDLKFK